MMKFKSTQKIFKIANDMKPTYPILARMRLSGNDEGQKFAKFHQIA